MATVDRPVGATTAPPTPVREASARRKAVGRMGPWQLTRLLNEGDVSRVYLARPLDRPDVAPVYAVKTLRREWWRDANAIEMIRREAHAGRSASHPNLAPVLSAQVSQPPFYVVMPRIEGQRLDGQLATGARPPLPVALWIARQVCQALAALYDSTGMLHSDVKPANILVGADGHATLLDLGFCQTPHEARSWASRPVVGSLGYIAPEMVTSACAVGPRSDLYSLGATLYEMLTGRAPFASASPAELVAMHRQEKPECVRELRPELPKPVASLVHRLLAKEPLRRPATHAEVVDELARLEIACFAWR